MAVNHIYTSTGFECDIDTEVLNDFEMLDLVTEADNGDIMALNKLINKMLGKEKDRLCDHLRNDAGRVPIDAMSREIEEIFGSLNKEAKN